MSAIIVLILRLLFSISLYIFLFLAIYRMWIGFVKPKNSDSMKIPEISLLLDDQEKPTSYNKNEISIGRDDDNDLTIDDETVSSQHAKIVYEKGNWMLEDLSSTNGTFLNNQRIYTPTVLIKGDEVMLGKRSLLINIPSESNL